MSMPQKPIQQLSMLERKLFEAEVDKLTQQKECRS